jgi:hypothetical protein
VGHAVAETVRHTGNEKVAPNISKRFESAGQIRRKGRASLARPLYFLKSGGSESVRDHSRGEFNVCRGPKADMRPLIF